MSLKKKESFTIYTSNKYATYLLLNETFVLFNSVHDTQIHLIKSTDIYPIDRLDHK